MKDANQARASLPRLFVGAIMLAGWIGPISPGVAATDYTFKTLIKTGDTVGGRVLTEIVGPISINNSGRVAFGCRFSDGAAICTSSEILVKTGDTISGKTLTDIGGGIINNSGRIAFGCKFAESFSICTPAEVLVQPGDQIGGETVTAIVGGGGFSDNGTVSFLATLPSGPPGVLPLAIFTQSKLVVKVGDSISGKTLNFVSGGSSNNAGTTAFFGAFGAGDLRSTGIFTQTTLLAKSGDAIGGQTINVIDTNPLINNQGTVAFHCGIGICSQFELLVREGENIGGTEVVGLELAGINDDAAIVFRGLSLPNGEPLIATQRGAREVRRLSRRQNPGFRVLLRNQQSRRGCDPVSILGLHSGHYPGRSYEPAISRRSPR